MRCERRRNRSRHRLAPAPFRAHGLIANPHLQMAAGALLRTRVLPMRIERLETPDDDFIELGWINEQAQGPLAVLVHGIGGGLSAGYLHAMAASLVARGWTCVALQLRGAGAEPNRQHAFYHHGDTGDLRWLCARLRAAQPARPLYTVGWSLGASIVIKALGEEGERSPLTGAVAISAPLQLRRCAEYLRTGPARVYQELMLQYVKRRLRRKYAKRGAPAEFDLPAALAARDFFEFGDAFTAKLCGFRDGREYCDEVDPGRYLAAIARPTLIVQARDDPFLGPAVVPELPVSSSIRIELAEQGGHVGFVGAGRWGKPASWLEGRVSAFLAERH